MVTLNDIIKNRKELPYFVSKVLQTGSPAIASELTFWNKTLRPLPTNYTQPFHDHEKEIRIALDEVKKEFGVVGKDVKFVDVGAGPRSRTTDGYDQGLYDLVAVDPLAEFYKKEFNGRGFLVKGKAEKLTKVFKPNTFHIAYASNSLDHGDSPEEGVKNMLTILKPGGVLMICGNEREGTRSHWDGMHQHNMWVEDNILYWQKRGESIKPILGSEVCRMIYLDRYNYEHRGTTIKFFFVMWKKI